MYFRMQRRSFWWNLGRQMVYLASLRSGATQVCCCSYFFLNTRVITASFFVVFLNYGKRGGDNCFLFYHFVEAVSPMQRHINGFNNMSRFS